MAKSRHVCSVYKEINVDVYLDNIDDGDLIEELQQRGYNINNSVGESKRSVIIEVQCYTLADIEIAKEALSATTLKYFEYRT